MSIDPVGLTTLSIQFDMQRLNTIANNAANALTPGFRRELLSVNGEFNAFMAGQATYLPQLSAVIDHKTGVQQQTNNSLDLAILDQGYFEVSTDHGYAYTRQGSFKLDEKGKLVTQAGQPVSGLSGDIYLNTSNPTIDSQGRVFENGKTIAQIKVVSFDRDEGLIKIGGGLLLRTDTSVMSQVELPKIAQGSLESSNVNSTQEMVSLMETFRHFEASHKVIQAYDELNDKALKNLSQF
jgi:flagellar basal-body rod protein FlgF